MSARVGDEYSAGLPFTVTEWLREGAAPHTGSSDIFKDFKTLALTLAGHGRR